VVAATGQSVSGTSGELDAFVFLINHSLSLEGGLLFLKAQQRMYVHSPSPIVVVCSSICNLSQEDLTRVLKKELLAIFWPQF